MKFFIKEIFKEKYSTLTDYKQYESILNTFLRKAIRVNTIKAKTSDIRKRLAQSFKLTKIPWSENGFWLESERRDLGNIYEHQLGYVYIQEAASMLPPIILNPKKKEKVLDMAASPGSKTTQCAAIMQNTGVIIANDINYKRMLPLSHNLQRCGVLNTITTIMDARKINEKFNKILLDAPCSGVGTIRGATGNAQYVMENYSQQYIKTLAGLQRRLILKAYDNLEEKGTLVYSTCSLEPEEDEGVIQFLLEETDAKLEKIDLKVRSEVNLDYGRYPSELNKCIKLWPQFYDTEGFFIAKIKKP